MLWNAGKKALSFKKMVESTALFVYLSKTYSQISEAMISFAFAWPYLLCIFGFFNIVYHIYFWNNIAVIMSMIQFIFLISLVTHFKNQLMGTKTYLSKVKIVKIKVVNVKLGTFQLFEEAKSICKKYPSFFNILENSTVDSNGYVILQRDINPFKMVLKYIKNINMELPDNVKSIQSIYYEAKFFGLEELAQKCDVKTCLLKSKTLKLKVDDKNFETKKETIIKHKGFYDLLKNCKIDDDGYFILQRDATHFEIILKYMETGIFDEKINVSSSVKWFHDIAYEAAFYGLTQLVKLCDVQKHLLKQEFINVRIGKDSYQLDLAVCQKYKNFFDKLKECKIDDNGCFVMQRDGKHFGKIWKYMKSGILDLTNDGEETKIIQCDALYYEIKEIFQACEANLQKVEANAAVFSRSVFNKYEKAFVIETGAAVVFLEFGFLGMDLKFEDKALTEIAKGLVDFMNVRNNEIFSDYALITDYTVPKEKKDYRIALDIYFNKKPVKNIVIFQHDQAKINSESVKEAIKDACLHLSYKMRQAASQATEGARQLAISFKPNKGNQICNN